MIKMSENNHSEQKCYMPTERATMFRKRHQHEIRKETRKAKSSRLKSFVFFLFGRR